MTIIGEKGAPRPPRAGTRALARQRLERVALRHFVENGIQGASLAQIAEELGITRQALSKRFGSKEGLFRAVLTSRSEVFRRLPISSIVGTPEEVLRVYAAAFVSTMVTEEGIALLRAYYGGIYRFPELARAEQAAVDQMSREIGAFLSGVARQAGAPERDWFDAGRTFIVLIVGLALPGITGSPPPTPEALKGSIERLVERFLRGEGLLPVPAAAEPAGLAKLPT